MVRSVLTDVSQGGLFYCVDIMSGIAYIFIMYNINTPFEDDYFRATGQLSIGLSRVHSSMAERMSPAMALRVAAHNAQMQKTEGSPVLCSVAFADAVPTQGGCMMSVNAPFDLMRRIGAQDGDEVDLLLREPDLLDPNLRGVVAHKVIAAKTPGAPAWVFDQDIFAPAFD